MPPRADGHAADLRRALCRRALSRSRRTATSSARRARASPPPQPGSRAARATGSRPAGRAPPRRTPLRCSLQGALVRAEVVHDGGRALHRAHARRRNGSVSAQRRPQQCHVVLLEDSGDGCVVRQSVPRERAKLFVELVAAAGGVDDDDLARVVRHVEERVRDARRQVGEAALGECGTSRRRSGSCTGPSGRESSPLDGGGREAAARPSDRLRR